MQAVSKVNLHFTSLSVRCGEGSEQQDSAGRRGVQTPSCLSAGGQRVKVQGTLNSASVTFAPKRVCACERLSERKCVVEDVVVGGMGGVILPAPPDERERREIKWEKERERERE